MPRFRMRILGLPLASFVVLIVVPALIVAYQFYYVWQVYTGRRD
jgi:cell division protein FtsB